MSVNIIDLLSPYKTRIEQAIVERVASWSDTRLLREASEYAVLNGGKRLRPALVLLVAQALGKGYDVTEAAMAIEFFHTASLVADDLPSMDNEEERRDCPTVHKVYGEATAILVSYVLIAAGYESLAKNAAIVPHGKQICAEAVQNVARNAGLQGAAGGQFLDLYPPDLSLETIEEAIRKKTVSLFEISFVLGWLFGGGDVAKLEAVKRAADHFGMAFQIADDFGDIQQDFLNHRQVNLVTVAGAERAAKMFHVELTAYRKVLQSLGVDSAELTALADLLEESIVAFLPQV